MAGSLDQRVIVFPFDRQVDEVEVVIGRPELARYLALPARAVEIIDDLAAGHTMGEAQSRFERRHGETPDVEALVAGLEGQGFLQRASAAEAGEAPAGPAPKRFHMEGFPEWLAKALFSRPVLIVGFTLVALAILEIIANPAIVPGPSALFFEQNTGLMIGIVAVLFSIQLCVHEASHMIAARARGVPIRFSLGHRLWLLVLETDMTGVWGLPPRKRILPLVAGPVVDLFTLSGYLLALAAEARGLVAWGPTTHAVLRAMVVFYMYQILWQTFLFVRTDFYYVIATVFGCKNLMQDTRDYLRNVLKGVGIGAGRDQSVVPARELRVIRWYSVLWVSGRVLVLWLLFAVQIPLVWSYWKLMGRAAVSAVDGTPLANPALVIPAVLGALTFGLGMFMWLRTLNTARLENAARARAAAVAR